MVTFKSGDLAGIINKLETAHFTGTATLISDSGTSGIVTKVFAFRDGDLTFAGDHLPSPLEFMEFLKQNLELSFVDSSIRIAEKRVQNKDSVREFLEFIHRFGIIKWDNVESLIRKELIQVFEPLLSCQGELQLNPKVAFDLSYGQDLHGFSWAALHTELDQRQQAWQSLLPITLDSVPVQPSASSMAAMPEDVREHLSNWVDGERSLDNIATALKQDPLTLATTYSQWRKQKWMRLLGDNDEQAVTALGLSSKQLPIVLSVDDSAIVQVSIKRAINDRYTVLCAKNAVEALKLLNEHKVELMLLDVTMPDIDGLELCRTIRGIPRFKNLPVVMLTAKDGLIDKVKGQFAGSTHYLSKPVDREKLLPILEKYIVAPGVAV